MIDVRVDIDYVPQCDLMDYSFCTVDGDGVGYVTAAECDLPMMSISRADTREKLDDPTEIVMVLNELAYRRIELLTRLFYRDVQRLAEQTGLDTGEWGNDEEDEDDD